MFMLGIFIAEYAFSMICTDFFLLFVADNIIITQWTIFALHGAAGRGNAQS